MKPIRAIILDFDGVLAESNEEKMGAFEDLFALYPEYRQAMMDYHLANYAKMRLIKFEYYVYQLMGRPGDKESLERMAQQFSNFVVRRVVNCSEVPGARAFLKEFYRQVPLYISSLTPQEELQRIVRDRGLDSFFVDVFGNPPHPKTEAIKIVLNREQLLPSEVLFVGDAASDYYAAAEMGIGFVGRNSGLPFNGVEIKLYRDFNEIADVVRQQLKD